MNNELYDKTRKLLRQLNHFILHVILYFFINMGLVLMAFGDIQGRWWIFFIIMVWAIALIYHGFRVYGVDILNSKNKKVNLLWSWLLKLTTG